MIYRASCGPESDPSSPSSSPNLTAGAGIEPAPAVAFHAASRFALGWYGNKQLAAHRRPLARANALARSPAARSSQRFAWSPAYGRTQIRVADSLDQANASSPARPASLDLAHGRNRIPIPNLSQLAGSASSQLAIFTWSTGFAGRYAYDQVNCSTIRPAPASPCRQIGWTLTLFARRSAFGLADRAPNARIRCALNVVTASGLPPRYALSPLESLSVESRQ